MKDTTSPAPRATGSPATGSRAMFALAAAVVGLCLAASALPSPMYGVYAARWHIPASTVTLIYAAYCFGVLAALLLLGRVSDSWGRRPVIAAGLAGLLVAMVMFMYASGVAWLFAARAVQGVATGVAISAAGAALLEAQPRRDAARAGLTNAGASALGVGAGGLLGAVLLRFAPVPLVVSFAVLAVLVVLLLGGLLLVPETVSARTGFRVAPPGVPRAILAPFALAGLGITCSWSVMGLYLGLVGTLAPDLMHTRSVLAAGWAIFAMGGACAAAPLITPKAGPPMQIARGTALLAVGVALIAWASSIASAPLFIAASVLTGWGGGLAMSGALGGVGAAAPADRRAQVMAAFYIVAYAAISVPAIGAGFTVRHLGAAGAFQVFGAGIAVVSLGTAALALTRHRAAGRAGAAPGGRRSEEALTGGG
ncbi:MFS transporter [Bailinhaonella thermotolerans]|uniref:MFS transporter n=1 Tax=Bailinhaonella thermotolerans TaxID=1070861 RepID=UPI00192A25EA|nr:MFS transporter [Bailinhaonella thermotolerans]